MQPTSHSKKQNLHLTQSDWDEWKDSPVTQHFFRFLEAEASTHRKIMGLSGCKRDSVVDTGMEYMLAATRAEVYELIGSVELDDTIEEEVDENKASGTQGSY